MAFKVSGGGFRKLKEIRQRFGQANVDRALEIASDNMQEEALNLVADGFASGTDPYGTPWNAPNDLQITGGTRRFTRGKSDRTGFRIHATDKKAIWHHDPRKRAAWGGKALPTRLLVPVKARGLPPIWAKRLREAAEDAVKVFRR